MIGNAVNRTGAPRRPRTSTLAVWALYAVVVMCEVILGRGFLRAAAADSAVFTGNPGPQNFASVSYDWLQMVTAWTVGAFHPSHLESWERSSLPISLLAVSAIVLSVYLRKRR